MLKQLLYVLLTLFSLMYFPQIKITGQILDTDDNPIEFARITLLTIENEIVKEELSDEAGNFIVELNTGGHYKIQIIYLKNLLFEKEITLTEKIDIGIIRSENSVLLDGVEITANIRPKIKKELGKFIIQNPANSPFAKNKPTIDFLRFVPILNLEKPNEISILNKGAATIYLNGRKIDDISIALSLLKSIPAEDIKTIEIITNPDSKFSSSNANGIINIITKKVDNEGFKGAVNSTISQSYYNSQNINSYLSYSRKKITTTASFYFDSRKDFASSNYVYDNLSEELQTQIANQSISKNKIFIGNLNFNYNLSENQNIGFQFYSKLDNIKGNNITKNRYNQINSNKTDSTYTTNILSISPDYVTSFKGNINYHLKTDKEGSNLDIELNYYSNKNNIETQNILNNTTNNNFIETRHFLQNPNIQTKISNYKVDFTKVINKNSKLYLGALYTNSDITNDFFFGNFNGNQYISDPKQTNRFKYKDNIVAGYISYERVFNNKWEAKAGLRLESFKAEGRTNTNNEHLKFENIYVFPSLSLLFTPNDNHEFSLDSGSYIFRPSYNQLNPFVNYTSPNSFKINNSTLKPTLTYEVNFNYSFYKNYMLDIGYEYNKNLFNSFDVVLPNNWIMTTTANYGNSNTAYLNFIYTNSFFKGYWNFSVIADYSYDKTSGRYNGTEMSFENNQYSFKTKNQIALNSKKDFSLSVNYGYSSGKRYVMGAINNLHSLEIVISKTYKNFNFSIGGYDLARADLKINDHKESYRFQKAVDYYKTIYLSINYSFGNKKVKRIQKKSDSDIDKRLL
ncbi:hypothetical protein CMU93_01075 [Elizabethkingia anophelis]|nr:hypothetical protein [Elizabethkingia anophelis]